MNTFLLGSIILPFFGLASVILGRPIEGYMTFIIDRKSVV